MKKAIIISGQIRTVELTKWFHKKSFIDDENCDIFLSIDVNNETQLLYQNDTCKTDDKIIKDIIEFYSPKKYYICNDNDEKIIYNDYKDLNNNSVIYYDIDDINEENQTNINLFLIGEKEQYMVKNININNLSLNSNIIKKSNLTENSIKGLFRQFYFVNKGYEQLKKYKEENNIYYDMVIRIRFDHIILTNNFIENKLKNYLTKNNTIIFCEENINMAKNIINLDLEYDKICDNTINVMGAGVYKKYVYVNDFFWTHDDNLIVKISKFYEQLHDIIKFSISNFYPIYGAGIEHFFAIFLFNNKININQTIMNKCNIIRKI